MKKLHFTKEDIGCYVDGCYGDKHLREVLASFCPKLGHELLNENDPETMNEAVYDAIDYLQDHTDDGLIWDLSLGDLCLIEESDIL